MPFQTISYLHTSASRWDSSWDLNGNQDYMIFSKNTLINETTEEKDEKLLMKLYKEELEKRKIELIIKKEEQKKDEPIDDSELDNVDFLKKIIQIKEKIIEMTKELKILQKQEKEINCTIDKHNSVDPFVNKNIYIENEIKSLSSKITLYRNIIKDNEESKPYDSLCSICQTDSITHCINPCGHTYCSECVSRLKEGSSCYICRKTVTSKIKMYIL